MRFKQKAFKKRRHNNNHNKSTKQSRSQIDASKYERWRGGTQSHSRESRPQVVQVTAL